MRNKTAGYIAVLAATLLAAQLIAGTGGSASALLPGMTVTALRLATPHDAVASAISVVDADEIEKLQSRELTDILSALPGVHVAQSGTMGSIVSIYIRGANSEHVLVLVDGVEVNDPSTAGRLPTIPLLDSSDIARVEILRGPQSALYGSDAIGGVINIVTKKGSGDPSASLSFEGGSFNTYRGTARVQGGTDTVSYSATVSHLDTEGISTADEADGNTEKDAYHRTVVSAQVGLSPADQYGFDFSARYISSQMEYDNGAGPGADAPDNVEDDESFFLRGAAYLNLFEETWQQTVSASLADHSRIFDDNWGLATFDSQLLKTEWIHNLHLHEANTITLGVEFAQEEAEDNVADYGSADTMSIFVQDQVRILDPLFLALSVRYDDHDGFGSEVTYRAAPVVTIDQTGTRLVATYGTGFKAPSLYQLYAPAGPWGPIGNANLNPETSTSWDAGFDQPLAGGKLNIGIRYFQSEIEDMIDFVSGFENVKEAETKGVEASASLQVCPALGLNATYTYTDTEDKTSGSQLLRRPMHRASCGASYLWNDKLSLNLSVLYVGERDDRYFDSLTFTPVNTQLDDYVLVNLAGSYKIRQHLEVFGRIENLTDEEYREIWGFGTPGISGYAGVKLAI